ncbi:MAG: hypothetical protein HQ503_19090 [Rhodospirillales bacterium]|nr:hypothetical protein [Rhodospirillales bacterium]
MLNAAKNIARSVGIDTTALYQSLSARSLDAAAREQGLSDTADKLRAIIPDLRNQYTGVLDEEEYLRYWEKKMRGLHAWQVGCVQDALEIIGGQNLVLADIGDSSGNHGIYLKEILPAGMIAKVISVNLDPVAIDKIKAKGGDAILSRAEELDLLGIKADLFMSFETVEHLTDPVRFLHNLATEGSAEYLFMSVPYRRTSRFGGSHLRTMDAALPDKMTAEEVHVYEFSPADWVLLARFAGFEPVFESTYLQYPKYSLFRLLAPLWRKLDFEGFFGVLLKRNLGLAERYADW